MQMTFKLTSPCISGSLKLRSNMHDLSFRFNRLFIGKAVKAMTKTTFKSIEILFPKICYLYNRKNVRQIVSDSPIKPEFVTKQITVFLTRIKRFAFLFNTTLLICNHEKLLSIRIAPASKCESTALSRSALSRR